jgi:putative endonuclease
VSTLARQELGRRGEQLALEHMERLGFTLVERNYRTRFGELDLVVFDGQALVFCEVKTRRSGPGSPFEAIHAGKVRRVRAMAVQWLQQTPDRPFAAELRCDAIGVTIDPRGRLVALEHLEGAF